MSEIKIYSGFYKILFILMSQGNDYENYIFLYHQVLFSYLLCATIYLSGERNRCDKGQITVDRNGTGAFYRVKSQVALMIRPLAMILNVQDPLKHFCTVSTRHPLVETGDHQPPMQGRLRIIDF